MMFKSVLLLALGFAPHQTDRERAAEKAAQMTAITAAIVDLARSPDEVAFLLTLGKFESDYSLDVHVGNCPRHRCDRDRHGVARARGPFQVHQNRMSDEKWSRMVGIENTAVQVEHAIRMSRWALNRCKKTGDLRVVTAFRVLGGRQCDAPLRGENERLATFKRLRASL